MFANPQSVFTVVDLLRTRAFANGDKQAFAFVSDHDGNEVTLTFRTLHERAMAIGGELQTMAAQGERALLLFPPGLEFIEAFFGCLYAGLVAVPAAPPSRNRMTSSVEAIFAAASPSLILSTMAHRKLAEQSYGKLSKLFERPWIATDRVTNDRQQRWHCPRPDGQQIAFLQYTSGSTSSPKGVMLTHQNLLHNAALIERAFGNRPEECGVSWLPLYHDMGLIGGVVQPVFCGASCTLLAPAAFLQRPALWLETISRTGAMVSGGPDFAYDLCARKISPAECQGLDLSRWEVAFTGAERVRAETIERFAAVFAPYGFRREAFFPCYGLAEATLMVSGGPRLTPPAIARLRSDALRQNRALDASDDDATARTLVGCGQCLPGHTMLIVDPHTQARCADGEVGEIWVQGPSISRGYYERPDATVTTFGGRLADTGKGPFLRTGDLGFVRNGQLFVTGRLKDVIIIRGRNYYPEDIERSVDRAHAAFRAGYCAAFSVEVDNRERLVVVQEIEPRHRNFDSDAAVQAIRRNIALQHELEVYAIVLVKAGEIPKTSSGKTRRSACRERYQGEQFEIIAQWKANLAAIGGESVPASETVCAGEIEGWLIRQISARLHLPPANVHVSTPFLEFGMGSVDAVDIAAELERWLGRRMSPTAIYNYPTIAALAQWLANPPTDTEASTRPSQSLPALGEMDPERLLRDVRHMTEEEMQAFVLQEMEKQ